MSKCPEHGVFHIDKEAARLELRIALQQIARVLRDTGCDTGGLQSPHRGVCILGLGPRRDHFLEFIFVLFARRKRSESGVVGKRRKRHALT